MPRGPHNIPLLLFHGAACLLAAVASAVGVVASVADRCGFGRQAPFMPTPSYLFDSWIVLFDALASYICLGNDAVYTYII